MQNEIHKIRCPICGKRLNFITDREVSFDMREFTDKVFCNNCKRQIKYSIKN